MTVEPITTGYLQKQCDLRLYLRQKDCVFSLLFFGAPSGASVKGAAPFLGKRVG